MFLNISRYLNGNTTFEVLAPNVLLYWPFALPRRGKGVLRNVLMC